MLLTSFWAEGQNFAKKRKELEAKRKALQEQITRNKQELQRAKMAEQSSVKQLTVIGTQIVIREQLIDHVSQEAFELSIEISNQKKIVTLLKEDIAKLKADYAAYLTAAYKKRHVNAEFLYIFDSKSIDQAVKRLKYLNTYGNYRQQQARVILRTQQQMIVALKELVEIKQQKLGLVQLKESEKKELVADKQVQTVLLEKVQKKVKTLAQTIAQQEQAARALNQSLSKLIAEEIAAAKKAEERKRAKELAAKKKPAAPVTSNSYLSDADLKLSGNFAANKGKLPWPAAGVLVQGFGKRDHPTLKGVVLTNNGIDIATPHDAPVRPVFKGTVKGIFPIPGLDKVILVNHGEYFTVYARLATVNVKIGQVVEPKDIIGNVALNEEDNTSKLHFEVWKQQVFQNPLPWLKSK
ncbi:MAG: peptidoglycan DD-metalloendopeptidase family protein [Bacteroidota bacterium]|nr:peptidoglycan DD-metalloendopeptidase family protein [Bacteroidota bacterium]